MTAAQVSTASGSGFGVAASSRFHSLGCAGDYGVLLRPSRHRTRGSWRPRPGIRLRLQNQEEAFRTAESEGVPGRGPAGGRVPVGRRSLGKNRRDPGSCPLARGSSGSSRCRLSPARPGSQRTIPRCPPGWLLVETLVCPLPLYSSPRVPSSPDIQLCSLTPSCQVQPQATGTGQDPAAARGTLRGVALKGYW
jgi:hypothetical protein